MEIEQQEHTYKLRGGSKSRSQTPSIQVRGTRDSADLAEQQQQQHHYDLRSRSRERSRTPGDVTTSRRTRASSLTNNIGKHGREQAMGVIIETGKESAEEKIRDPSSSEGTLSSLPSRRVKSDKPTLSSANGQTNTSKNTLDETTVSRRNRKKGTGCSVARRVMTSDYSSEEGEREDASNQSSGSAYQIYKQVGDWWNVFPKTDYTYSQASQCRYEIAPGVLAMPNMSRRSLHSEEQGFVSSGDSQFSENYSSANARELSGLHSEETSARSTTKSSSGIEKSRTVFTKTRAARRYGSEEEVSSSYQRNMQTCDSDAELEDAFGSPKPCRRLSGTRRAAFSSSFRWCSTGLTVVAAWFRNLLQVLAVSTVRRKPLADHGSRGHDGSLWITLWRNFDQYTQYLYFLVVKMFFFDSWLLSRFSHSRAQLQERGSAAGWFLLLAPLLLLAGFWCVPCALVPEARRFAQSLGQTRTGHVPADDGVKRSSSHSTLGEHSRTPVTLNQLRQLESLVERLRNQVDELEKGTLDQAERISDVTRALGNFLESRVASRATETDKKSLPESELVGDVDWSVENVRTKLEALKKECSRLGACCSDCVLRQNGAGPETVSQVPIDIVQSDYDFRRSVTKGELLRILRGLILSPDVEDTKSAERKVREYVSSYLTDMRVREIAKEVLKVYDADKTGRVDYALESAGGLVISTQCTQRYDLKRMAITILGFTLYYENNNPRTVIQGHPIQPGTCWAFQGFPGYLLIKLRSLIYVTGFTLEHAPKSILPNEEMKSAPRTFNVWGFTSEVDPNPFLFGDYEFVDSEENLQYFQVQNTAIGKPFEYVELRVHSNHGQLEYTCLYRFRVHGKPA